VLDVALRNITVADRLRDVSAEFTRNSHTAIVGPPAAGASTLLQVIAGDLRPDRGSVIIGTRDVTSLKRARRPLLYATSNLDAPLRWSVRHLLIAAVRRRTLDRQDRQREFELTAEKWRLSSILDRPLRALSSSEQTLANLARIELLRPAVLVADRLLQSLNASLFAEIADDFYRTLRVIGATVINTPSSALELGFADQVVVLEGGRVVQEGTPGEVYRHPISEAVAVATGEVNVIPIHVKGNLVESAIGTWKITRPTFEGSGVALARPHDFEIAPTGEESDLIFGVEEASFRGDRWQARGVLSGNVTLRVELPAGAAIHKGRLIPLRFDPNRFTILARDAPAITTVPTDVVPPLSESR
jgi:ABC-type sugar transport system ATPase subunit